MAEGLSISGVAATLLNLKRTEERTSKAMLQAMRKGGDRVRDLARLNSPIDEGDLEAAIVALESRGARNRIEIDVGVDMTKIDRQFDYPTWVHENTALNLGPRSQEKADRVDGSEPGAKVGPKYLERAFSTLEDDLVRDVEAALEKALK